MSWFGWVTKPKLEVSGLDHLIGYCECVVAIAIVFLLLLTAEKIYLRLKR